MASELKKQLLAMNAANNAKYFRPDLTGADRSPQTAPNKKAPKGIRTHEKHLTGKQATEQNPKVKTPSGTLVKKMGMYK